MLGFNINPPFFVGIMQDPIPAKFKLPHLESYDGSEDLVDHLMSFWTYILLHLVPDAVLCLAFPSTLKEVARQWYSSLKLSSIDSFNELDQLFVSHMASS